MNVDGFGDSLLKQEYISVFTVEPPLMNHLRSRQQWTGMQLATDLAIYTSLIWNEHSYEPPRVDNLSTTDRICALNLSIVERFHCIYFAYR